jgi:hypothetical protein
LRGSPSSVLREQRGSIASNLCEPTKMFCLEERQGGEREPPTLAGCEFGCI